MKELQKRAAMESAESTDPKTGKKIRVSTTTRLIYRETYPTEYGHLRNSRLNQVIARDFIQASSQVVHYFRLGTGDDSGTTHRGVAEIRGNSSSFFISAIREGYIDILTIQNDWLKPKYKGSSDNPIALGDS